MKETKIEKLILDLSNRWEVSPEEAVDRLNSMNESEINKLINSMTKKFKNGGMIDCLRKGGSIKDCGCGSKINKDQEGGVVKGGNWKDYHTIINAPGDTLRFKQYFSGPTTMQTHPEGGVTYTKSTVDGISHMYGGGYQPNMWEKLVLRMSPVDAETEQNWQQLIKNHKNDPAVKDKTKKKENGGVLKAQNGAPKVAKSAMYDSAMELVPEVFETKKDVRTAYRTAKNLGREQGLSGRDLKNWSRNQVIDKVGTYVGDEPIPHVPFPPDGRVVRSTMFETSQELTPQLTRKDVRGAYGIAKNWGREAGLKGRDLRQYARNTVIDKMYDYADGPDTTLVNGSSSVNNETPVESGRSLGTTNRKRNVFDFVQSNGLSKSQTRLAYQNQLNGLRNQGLRGSELRQAALNNMTNTFLPKINNDID